MRKFVFLLILLGVILFTSTTSSAQKKLPKTDTESFSYAFVWVQGKLFSKKLIVEVDFGDSPEQVKAGKEYSEYLTNKKSFAAVLNYMAEQQFELINTQELTFSANGTGGTDGIIFIMKKNKNAQ
ncbi:MAG TPA: hypothetical protein PL009_08010 [Flavipsychrobacter sp.]|nr:hypothetical protein [Flavipsychrobacter sp.]